LTELIQFSISHLNYLLKHCLYVAPFARLVQSRWFL